MEQARIVPGAPRGASTYRGPTAIQQVVDKVDWASIANKGMDVVAELIRERRASRSGPSVQEQIGSLALSAFAGNLGKQSGTAIGKGILSGQSEDYVTVPVLGTMLGEFANRISAQKQQEKRGTDADDALASEILRAKDVMLKTMASRSASSEPSAPQQEESHAETHEEPQV